MLYVMQTEIVVGTYMQKSTPLTTNSPPQLGTQDHALPPKMPPLIIFLLLLRFLTGAKSSSESELQILLQLKSSLKITSWNSTSPCHFPGISCNSASSVTKIDLSSSHISGNIPFSSLCQLPSLTNLTLATNFLSGELTSDLRNCTELTYLDLSYNNFTGTIPDLSPLGKLEALVLSDNLFSGVFPWKSLRNLTSLTFLSLGDNSFSPSDFPVEVTELTNLTTLFLSVSNIHGQIPPSIGNLTALTDLELACNHISGTIPVEITKLNKLYQLEGYNNSLTGNLPSGFGNLSELVYLDFTRNSLQGNISELRNLSKLVSLQLFFNQFSGEVPAEFGDFEFLETFSLYSNRFSGELPATLGSKSPLNIIDISTNLFTGSIPSGMCNMKKLTQLSILENKFSGEIPASYGNCTSLVRLRVSKNSLSGTVPAGIFSLPKLEILDLAANEFEGMIDAGIGKAKSLDQIYLTSNNFSGTIPAEIATATALVSMDLSFNGFSGEIPASIGELKSLGSLLLEKNSLSGAVPDSIGQCTSLTSINLADNYFSGEIPTSLGQLPSLNSLNLSSNKFSGAIPQSLSSLKLSSFDLSNNELTGEIPAVLSISAFNDSFKGNPNLCSSSISYLKACYPNYSTGSSKVRIVLICMLVAFALLLCSIGLFLWKKRRSDRTSKNSTSWSMKSFRILSFDEQEIIKTMSKENIIGKGGSGNVYRVVLGGGKTVAVKHILHPSANTITNNTTVPMLPTQRSVRSLYREFEAEVDTLSSIRHVNVVKLYCSITSEDSSLLVYEYLPNGSLWDRIHSVVAGDKMGLDWERRYEIAVGAAKGLEYLHHGCDRPIVHRDVKSSNILLDEYFKPRIADFGLAKMLQSGLAGKDSMSSTHVIAGTHGYIAPEYAYTWKVTEKSDVYSFGVVLMELVTGRRPIEAEYGENKDIVYWVASRMTSGDSIVGIVDDSILESAKEEAARVLKVGVLCTARLRTMRPSMRTVVQMLEDACGASRLTREYGSKHQGFDGGGDGGEVKLDKVSSYKV